MNGPLYMQTVNRTVLVRRVKRKGDGPSKQLARWFVENQIGMCTLSITPNTSFCTHPGSFNKLWPCYGLNMARKKSPNAMSCRPTSLPGQPRTACCVSQHRINPPKLGIT